MSTILINNLNPTSWPANDIRPKKQRPQRYRIFHDDHGTFEERCDELKGMLKESGNLSRWSVMHDFRRSGWVFLMSDGINRNIIGWFLKIHFLLGTQYFWLCDEHKPSFSEKSGSMNTSWTPCAFCDHLLLITLYTNYYGIMMIHILITCNFMFLHLTVACHGD